MPEKAGDGGDGAGSKFGISIPYWNPAFHAPDNMHYWPHRGANLNQECCMKNASIIVRAFWDEEAQVWFAASSDIEGLSVEAETMEALETKVIAAVSDLLELNGTASDLPEIPIHIMAEHFAKVPNPHM